MGLNYWLYRLKYRYARELNLSRPVDVAIELASRCSMHCQYCYWADPKNIPFEPGIMSKETAMLILRGAADIGANSLKFNWKGEGTLNPHYKEITSAAKSLAGGSTFIDRVANTNFKFHPTKRDEIFDGLNNLTKVKISYDSFIKEVFEEQRAGGDHKLTTENINLFYNHLNRKNTEIVIQAVRTQLNKDEDIVGEVTRRWPEATCNVNEMVTGRVNTNLDKFKNKDKESLDRKPCLQAFSRLVFNWKGEAFPCCVDISESMKLGDISKDSMSDIFNSNQAYELRKALKNKTAFSCGTCKTCSSFESYEGWSGKWTS